MSDRGSWHPTLLVSVVGVTAPLDMNSRQRGRSRPLGQVALAVGFLFCGTALAYRHRVTVFWAAVSALAAVAGVVVAVVFGILPYRQHHRTDASRDGSRGAEARRPGRSFSPPPVLDVEVRGRDALVVELIRLAARPDGRVQVLSGLVPLENSIEWLNCAVASGLDAVMVGWPGAAEDHLLTDAPDTRPGCPSVPRRPGEGCGSAGAPARERGSAPPGWPGSVRASRPGLWGSNTR
jgi:hypothetical protein